MLSDAPDMLCFAFPCLLAYFREATNLCCAHEANPCVSFWKAGRVQNICYQATARPVPLQSGFVYTPSGSISQQHYITLTGSPHLTERNMIGLFSPANQNASYPQLFLRHSTMSFSLCCIQWELHWLSCKAAQVKLKLRLSMKKLTRLLAQPLAKIPEAYYYMSCGWRFRSVPVTCLITHLFSSKSNNSFLAQSKAFLHAYVNMACMNCINWNAWVEIKEAEPGIY